jgi:hypothetical protein
MSPERRAELTESGKPWLAMEVVMGLGPGRGIMISRSRMVEGRAKQRETFLSMTYTDQKRLVLRLRSSGGSAAADGRCSPRAWASRDALDMKPDEAKTLPLWKQ